MEKDNKLLQEINEKVDSLIEYQIIINNLKKEIESIKKNWKASKLQLGKKYDLLKNSYDDSKKKLLISIKNEISKYPIIFEKDIKNLKPKQLNYLKDRILEYYNFINDILDIKIKQINY